jgi:hypothetical protein
MHSLHSIHWIHIDLCNRCIQCIHMVKPRKDDTDYRNVRLYIDTYNKLDRYLLELMQKRGDRRLSFDEAIKSLIEDHYSGKSEKERKS